MMRSCRSSLIVLRIITPTNFSPPFSSRVKTLLFPVSRFVVDPERFDNDALEPMAERGQGVIYMGTTGGQALRRALDENVRTSLLERYYIPHHEALTTAAKQSLAANGFVTIIDAHSFPDTPLHVDLSQSVPRPDICLGTVAGHTPPELTQIVQDLFVNAGYSVKIDEPYKGTIVPLEFYNKEARVSSIMIEINRKLYLDGEPGSLVKSDSFTAVQNTIQSVIESVISWTNDKATACAL